MPVNQKQVEELIHRFKKIKGARVNWDSLWADITKYCIPRKGKILGPGTPGEKHMKEIYDGTAIWSLEILAAGLNTFLTSTVNKWFALKTEQDDLMESEAVKSWLQEVEKRMYNMFNNSNFSDVIHESYLDDGSIGTSIMYAEPDIEEICRFYTRHISECYVLENNKGRIDTLMRVFPFTARQAYQEWGAKASLEIKKHYDKDPEKELEFLHIIQPREERDERSATRDNLPYASIYIYPKTNQVLDEGGYHEKPFMVNRWLKGTRETYGRSPAMAALSDIKMLNKMGETTIKAAEKAVDPPLILPDDGMIGTVRLVPAGLNYVRASMLEKKIKPEPMKLGGDIRLGLEMEDQRRTSIRRFFWTELFLLLMDRPQMTATEVLERVDEKMTILSPVLGRMMNEKLDPIIDRCFGIMLRAGYFPPAPPELEGQKIVVEYVSKLARVQKLYEANAVRNTLADIGPYSQIDPSIMDNIDTDELFNVIAEVHGMPQRIRRPRNMVTKIREARQEPAQEEAVKDDAERLVQGMATAKNAGLMDVSTAT